MGKLSIFFLALMIFVGIGLAVHRGWNDKEKQKQVPAVVSEKESAMENISIEELASKGEKVSFEEALSKTEQANTQMKEQAEIYSIGKIAERLRKDGLSGLIAHFRGKNGENHDPQSNLAAIAVPSLKGPQGQRTEKENTDSVRLEIERLRKEEEDKRAQREKLAGQTGQATQQTLREKQEEDEKKDFFAELRETWDVFKSAVASSE